MPETAGDGALRGKVAIVTGGGTGIGRSIAERFAGEGAAVVVAGRRWEPLQEVAAEISGTACPTDVSNESDVVHLFETCRQSYGRLDVLVNNAGVIGPIADASGMDMEGWDEVMAINVRGVILCTKHALPMMKTRGGSIINVSSISGLQGYPSRSAYVASKFAVNGITESVAHEVGIDGIRVNSICPGAVHGDLMERVIAKRERVEGRSREEIIASSYTDTAALRRWVESDEVAGLALFLASDASSAITGQLIRIDAGRM